MIRKYARLDAEPETVAGIFRDVQRWPEWQPTIEAVEVLELSDAGGLVEVRQRLLGRLSKQVLRFAFDERGYTEQQVSGNLKSWRVEWRFSEPPSGRGTIASTRIDFSLGWIGLLLPRRRVQRVIDEVYEAIVSRVEARARRRETQVSQTVWRELPGHVKAVRVYETATELEVWIGERRFAVPLAE